MTHFTTLVILPEYTEEALEEALMPFHEYECTGIERYLVDVDRTDEVLKKFQESQQVVVLRDGTVVSRWDDSLYTRESDPDQWPSRKEFELPEGAREETISAEEARLHGIGYATMDQCASEYFGIEESKEGRYYKRTNPNAKWDWWVLGGRWQGLLIPREGAEAHNGTSGLMDSTSERGGVDAVRKRDLDIQQMKKIARGERAEKWRKCIEVALENGLSLKGLEVDEGELDSIRLRVGEIEREMEQEWEAFSGEVRAKIDRRAWAEERYGDLHPYREVFFDWGPRVPLQGGLQEWIDSAPPFTTYSVLKDGQWFTRGEMGWWGMSSNEMTQSEWAAEYEKLLESTPDDHWLVVVDCHI